MNTKIYAGHHKQFHQIRSGVGEEEGKKNGDRERGKSNKQIFREVIIQCHIPSLKPFGTQGLQIDLRRAWFNF